MWWSSQDLNGFKLQLNWCTRANNSEAIIIVYFVVFFFVKSWCLQHTQCLYNYAYKANVAWSHFTWGPGYKRLVSSLLSNAPHQDTFHAQTRRLKWHHWRQLPRLHLAPLWSQEKSFSMRQYAPRPANRLWSTISKINTNKFCIYEPSVYKS